MVERSADELLVVARSLADSGEFGALVDLMTDDRRCEIVAAVLAEQRWADLDDLGLPVVRAVIERLGPTRAQRFPAVLLHAARVAELRDPQLRRRWLDGALEACVEGHPMRPQVLAELAREVVRTGDVERATALGVEALGSAEPGDVVARGRALVALGQANTIRATPTALAQAADQLAEAIVCLRLAKERRWEADALLFRSYAVSFHAGRFAEAAEGLERVLALIGADPRQRAIVLTYLADVLDHLGRIHEALSAGEEALSIGRRLGDPMIVWYAAWALMLVEGHRGDIAGVRRWADAALEHAGHWDGSPKWIEFDTFRLDIACAVGDEVTARALHAQVSVAAERAGLSEAFAPADFRYQATFGDPVAALSCFDTLDRSPFAVQRARWVRRMIAALAARRAGDDVRAGELVRDALAEAALIEAPDLPARHESRAMALLADLLDDPPAVLTGRRLTMLGGFRLEAGGRDVTPQPGHPSTLMKVLALRGQSSTDEMVDLLWPDIDTATGRARLRNLLHRIRSRSGDIVVRHGETLSLAVDLDIDVAAFTLACDAAIAADDDDRVGAALSAVALYGGELLPGDRFEEWAAAPRERLRRRYVALCDLLADDAVARGDLDDAVHRLDLGMVADPLDEGRPLRAAELLWSAGRHAAASAMAETAERIVRQLGLPVPERLRTLMSVEPQVGS